MAIATTTSLRGRPLHELRSDLNAALAERKQLPQEIESATSRLVRLRGPYGYEIAQLRSDESRLRDLAEEIARQESGDVTYLSDERTEKYLLLLAQANECAAQATMLEGKIEVAQQLVADLVAEQATINTRIADLEDERDRRMQRIEAAD